MYLQVLLAFAAESVLMLMLNTHWPLFEVGKCIASAFLHVFGAQQQLPLLKGPLLLQKQ